MIVAILTAFTLIAFAANSLLCRMALGGNLIDPVSFTAIRLVSGAVALATLSHMLSKSNAPLNTGGSWGSGFALFAYATAFSLAYKSLSTGMGALILFGAVQVTMIGAALKSGENLRPAQWAGSAAAVGGLIYLVLPGLSAPDPIGALLMCCAGIAWGVYSIRGRGVSAPVPITAGNFLRSAPMALIASGAALSSVHLERSGILLALISGIVTSGLGYVLWYRALRSLTTTQASVVQLLVPVLAAFGGITFLSEHVSVRLIAASTLILGGVAMAVVKPDSVQGHT
ncbi:MAG TPA: EamA family transporter [Nitrospiraceae bacterium]|nr:EamA family transporter [Nitrospiraceae bacterium]